LSEGLLKGIGLESAKTQRCQDDNKDIEKAFKELQKKPCAVSTKTEDENLRNLQAAPKKKDDTNSKPKKNDAESNDECTKQWSKLTKAVQNKVAKVTFWGNQNTALKKTCASKKSKKRILFRKRVLQAAKAKVNPKKKTDGGSSALKCEDKTYNVLRGELFVCLGSHSALLKILLAGVIALFAVVY